MWKTAILTVKSFDNRHLAITLLNNSYEMILINFVIPWDKNILTKHVISESCKDLAWQVGKKMTHSWLFPGIFLLARSLGGTWHYWKCARDSNVTAHALRKKLYLSIASRTWVIITRSKHLRVGGHIKSITIIIRTRNRRK